MTNTIVKQAYLTKKCCTLLVSENKLLLNHKIDGYSGGVFTSMC
jgi:hypothetical protein